MRGLALLLLGAASAVAQIATAAPVELHWTGTVASRTESVPVSRTLAEFDAAGLTVGAPVSGVWIYDDAQTDSNPDPTQGLYATSTFTADINGGRYTLDAIPTEQPMFVTTIDTQMNISPVFVAPINGSQGGPLRGLVFVSESPSFLDTGLGEVRLSFNITFPGNGPFQSVNSISDVNW